jgi:TolB-like protein/class 3 adenylate cyclase
MAEKGFKRKLTAILSADVEGYSRLMGEDEEATVRTLTAYREVLTTLIQQHNGKVLDSPGDNLLAEFASVVDAVQCAVAVQKEIKARNDELSENRRMQFRIGINLGDVIQEEEQIYGDGVNIAARLEGLAEPGGICISKTAFDQIESKLPYGYEFLGDQEVKNIARPVGAYRVLMEPRVTVAETPEAEKPTPVRRMPMLMGAIALLVVAIALVIWQFYIRRPSIEPASVEKMAYSLPDKPSIAVLPFNNLSGDPEQEYFCDGMTEDLITDLSKISGIFVIARNSTFAYKGKAAKIRQVAEELGVRYVLEGSVRKANNQIRINAQLIDAVTGHHLWADRYDGNLENVFALQDKVTQNIIGSLAVKLTPNEKQHFARKDTDNVEAYDTFLKGWEHCLRLTPDDFAKAVPYLEKAIELDPNYGRAYAAMALTYWTTSLNFWKWEPTLGITVEECYLSAPKYLAMAIKNPTSLAHQVNADMMLHKRLHGYAIFEAERAIELDPNNARAKFMTGKVLIFDGRPEKGAEFIKKAMRLDPHYPAEPLCYLGLAHFCMGQLEKAVSLIERGLKHNPELYRFNLALAAASAHLGLNKKAQEALDTWMRGHFYYHDLKQKMFDYPFKNLKVAEQFVEGLIKAGWPGETSDYYKISEENRLTEEQIKSLVFGRKMAGTEGLIERTKDGIAYCRKCFSKIVSGWKSITFRDTGKSWVEDDMLCDQWQNRFQGQKICSPVFRNPEGKREKFDEYFSIPGLGESFGIIPWSPVD